MELVWVGYVKYVLRSRQWIAGLGARVIVSGAMQRPLPNSVRDNFRERTLLLAVGTS